MWKIITYSSNGKVIEKFDSTEKAFAEWNTYNPWTNHLKKEMISIKWKISKVFDYDQLGRRIK